ncbi:MAG: hypothetical protein V1854_05010 [Methanobacteriota archaeon]
MKDKFFAYDFENGFNTHATEIEARASAEKSIDMYRDDADSGWSSDVEHVCYGRIIAGAKERIIKPEDPPCRGMICCANCPKGELAEGIEDGKEYTDYILEPIEKVLPPGITGKCREYELALLNALEYLEQNIENPELSCKIIINIIKNAFGG